MISVHQRALTAAGLSAVALLGVAACSNDSKPEAANSSAATSSSVAMTAPAPAAKVDPAADLVGASCAAYAEQVPSGPGSVSGMSMDPVATAASNNPMLKTLTQAVSGKL